MKRLVRLYLEKVKLLGDLPPLLFRLTLAYGFYGTAVSKIKNIEGVTEWFTSLGYPLPALNAYLAAGTESIGVVLLGLGLGTRLIAPPLMFVMLIAITTVHLKNGFSCGDNGFEIPFYFFLMLLSLTVTGAGRASVDYLLAKK